MTRIITISSLLLTFSVAAQNTNWSGQMAATVMNIWKDSFSLDGKPSKWSYDQGVILKGFEGLWLNTGDAKYYDYIQKCMDFYVKDDGTIKSYKENEYNIDNVNNGRLLLLLYRVTMKEKYLKAAQLLREQLRHQPRTNEGGFWHKNIYPYQIWLDGLYMGEPFYAEYAWLLHEDTAFNDIANQFIRMEQHARDAKTGLLYHAYDESKQQKWADPITGHSPNFWARAMGWYAMALVDVLDYFPADHPRRKELIAILNRLTTAIEKVQDTKTGLWWDVLNMPGKKGNYLEASAAGMFVYTVAKGVRKGYLPQAKLVIAKKGYAGIIKQFIRVENSQTNLYGTVKVSGLGGNPYRDGSYEYYISEPVVVNDPKGIGAFLLAVNEMELLPTLRLGKGRTVLLDNYFNHEIRKEVTGDDVPFHYIWSEMDNNGYSLFGYVFNKYGVQTKTLATVPTSQNLKEADIYIIVDPDTEKESKMPNYIQLKDIAAIQNWVKTGGELLLMANDSGNVEFQHFNQLAERFGIHFNEDSKNKVQGNNFEQGAIRIPAYHPIFTNPKKIYIKELSTIQAKDPATIVLKKSNDNIIAVSKYGKGIVLAVGDPWFYNEYFDGRKLPVEYENYAAANDLVRWLIKPLLSQSSK
jgi:unsaturated rhamnogalacturonyl hydrolase